MRKHTRKHTAAQVHAYLQQGHEAERVALQHVRIAGLASPRYHAQKRGLLGQHALHRHGAVRVREASPCLYGASAMRSTFCWAGDTSQYCGDRQRLLPPLQPRVSTLGTQTSHPMTPWRAGLS